MSSGPAGGLPQQKTECADQCTADGVGHMHRQIAGKLTGRVTKWIVLVFWILAVGILGSFAGKLTEVQNNEAASWLPGNAYARGFAITPLSLASGPSTMCSEIITESKPASSAIRAHSTSSVSSRPSVRVQFSLRIISIRGAGIVVSAC